VAAEYHTSRKAIVALGGDGEGKYKDLSSKDIDVKSINGGRNEKHTGKLTNGWIFEKIVSLAGSPTNDTEWEKDSKCSLN
jgi:hypothetical protein